MSAPQELFTPDGDEAEEVHLSLARPGDGVSHALGLGGEARLEGAIIPTVGLAEAQAEGKIFSTLG